MSIPVRERLLIGTLSVLSAGLLLVGGWLLVTFGPVIALAGVALLYTHNASYQGCRLAMSGFDHYCSGDRRPVEVTLRSGSPKAPTDDSILLRIPRAYINYAEGYAPKTTGGALPDRIDTRSLKLALQWPDGEPMSVHGTPRADEYHAQINYVRADWPWDEMTRSHKPERTPRTTYDGLEAYEDGVPTYYGTPGEDEFVKIRCYPELNPIAFCTTDMRIGTNLVAYVTFVDFRLHGGRAFANERARKLRETVCGFTTSGC